MKLQDIAQASGVSLTAVSLALGDKPGISQMTRERVVEVARSLGYRFKSSGAKPAARTIKTIGLMVKAGQQDDPHSNHFYSQVTAGVEATCRQLGMNLMFLNLPVDRENVPLDASIVFEKGDVDAVLIAGVMISDEMSRTLENRRWPIVLIDSYSPSCLFHSVISDNFSGSYQATSYLIQKGHRNIAFLGGFENTFPSFRDRRAGYQKALKDAGIDFQCISYCSDLRSEILQSVREVLERHPDLTAIIGVNDEAAINTLYSLVQIGYQVPQDISIIGFDDIYLAGSIVPALTTMRVDKQGMGRLAVQMLVNQFFQPESGYITSVFRPSLIERNSVASPRSGA